MLNLKSLANIKKWETQKQIIRKIHLNLKARLSLALLRQRKSVQRVIANEKQA